eukprot:4047835-Pleurochrysis_carterae.AAC.1
MTPSTDDWGADFFGVILPPASAHATWAADDDEIDTCTDPTVRNTIASTALSTCAVIMHGIRAFATTTRS